MAVAMEIPIFDYLHMTHLRYHTNESFCWGSDFLAFMAIWPSKPRLTIYDILWYMALSSFSSLANKPQDSMPVGLEHPWARDDRNPRGLKVSLKPQRVAMGKPRSALRGEQGTPGVHTTALAPARSPRSHRRPAHLRPLGLHQSPTDEIRSPKSWVQNSKFRDV